MRSRFGVSRTRSLSACILEGCLRGRISAVPAVWHGIIATRPLRAVCWPGPGTRRGVASTVAPGSFVLSAEVIHPPKQHQHSVPPSCGCITPCANSSAALANLQVAGALAAQSRAQGKPVVALESTIISHGMPFPQNLETARAVEAVVRIALR
jgi:hypothetical protein